MSDECQFYLPHCLMPRIHPPLNVKMMNISQTETLASLVGNWYSQHWSPQNKEHGTLSQTNIISAPSLGVQSYLLLVLPLLLCFVFCGELKVTLGSTAAGYVKTPQSWQDIISITLIKSMSAVIKAILSGDESILIPSTNDFPKFGILVRFNPACFSVMHSTQPCVTSPELR